MILSAVCTCNFFQAIFLHVVRFLFHCISHMSVVLYRLPCGVHIFGIWRPQGSRYVLPNSLKTIADLHLLESTGLIKYLDIRVGLDLFFTFSNGDSSYVCNSLFSQNWFYLLFCNQCQLPTPHNSLGSLEFFMQIGSEFRRMKDFYF